MLRRRTTLIGLILCLVAGCGEPPPRSVTEFMNNPILLEAAVVRCARNRSETRYDAECINAREAVKRIAASEEAERRAELDAQSERKRQALRRTQEAAAEARRRAADAERRQREAEYLAQFGQLPPDRQAGDPGPMTGNEPVAVIPDAPAEPESEPAAAPGGAPVIVQNPPPAATDGGNAPQAVTAPPADLGSIRDELRRRNEAAPE